MPSTIRRRASPLRTSIPTATASARNSVHSNDQNSPPRHKGHKEDPHPPRAQASLGHAGREALLRVATPRKGEDAKQSFATLGGQAELGHQGACLQSSLCPL